MTAATPSPPRGLALSVGLAVRVGLLVQAAFSVAMLRHYTRHGSSFYLTSIAGAWPYVPQHLLWIGAFLALSAGATGLARVLASGAAFLAVVQVISVAHGGGLVDEVARAAGVACLGVLPAIALLFRGTGGTRVHRNWLIGAAVVALAASLASDGISQYGGVSPLVSVGVVRVVLPAWLVAILALAWAGRLDAVARAAAFFSTAHLFVVQMVWLVAAAWAGSHVPGLALEARIPRNQLVSVLVVGAVLVLLGLYGLGTSGTCVQSVRLRQRRRDR